MKREKPIIVVNSLSFDHAEFFEVQMPIKKFDKKIEEDFADFVENTICIDLDKYGIYEYDGKFGNFEYILQTDFEEEDELEVALGFIRTEIENYFKSKNIELIQLEEVEVDDKEDLEDSFFNFQKMLNEHRSTGFNF